MVYGPCGGVRDSGRCELDDRRCCFVDRPLPLWDLDRPVPNRRPVPACDATPLIICDVRPPEPTLSSVRSVAELHRFADVVLVGDHHETVDLPSSVVGAELARMGLEPWVTLSCRDRNRVALEADLVALRELGVRTVHCVTGDARAPHVRPGSTAVFDLDSHRLVALATSLGLVGSVAETPGAPPTGVRVHRAVEKHRAGASWCFVNLSGRAAVARFVRTLHDRAPALRLVVCIPVYTDAEGLRRLRALPGVDLEAKAAAQVLETSAPRRAGIEKAAAAARDALSLPGVSAVNLTGPASTRGVDERASVLAAVAERVRR
jgi:5,10-methylenetetrahydrofolate reductase